MPLSLEDDTRFFIDTKNCLVLVLYMPLGYINNPNGVNGWGTTRPQLSLADRIAANTQKTETCWFWTGRVDKDGYGEMKVDRKDRRVTHLVYEMKTGQLVPVGMVIRHKCDVRNCINPDHLEVGSHADNVQDKMERGRWRGNQRLTQDAIFEIQRRGRNGERQSDLAEEFGISQTHVSRLVGPEGKRYNQRISKEQKAEIFKRHANGESQVKLAAEFGVTQAAIWYMLKHYKSATVE